MRVVVEGVDGRVDGGARGDDRPVRREHQVRREPTRRAEGDGRVAAERFSPDGVGVGEGGRG